MAEKISAKTRFKHRFEYLIVKLLKKGVLHASKKTLKVYQFVIFALLYFVFRVNYKIVDTNLTIAFPELTQKARKKLLIANYRWSAQMAVAMLRMDYWRGKTAEYVSFHNLAVLDEALSEDNGVLLISAHLGHWEMIVPALAEKGYPLHVYVGAQSNPLVDKLQNQTRGSFGVDTIAKGDTARFKFIRVLSNKEILAYNPDQNNRKSKTFVQFFNKAATLPKSTAGFHLARKSPIVMIFAPFVGDKLEIFLQRLNYEQAGNKEEDLFNITEKISNVYEKYIRLYPEQYFWMHRRWKTRPPEDPDPIY